MAAAGISFANVSYSLPTGRTLLRNISLTLTPCTITAVLGRSGSGKTTLLRMVNGMVQPTSGAVLLDGQSIRDANPTDLRRSIGYVIQETGLFPHMTVERNAALALELAGTPAPERTRRTAEVLALVGLNPASFNPAGLNPAGLNPAGLNPAGLDSARLDFAEFRVRYPWQLSGGQRQRVGLARALAADPAVLLMDEPFGALDPLTRADMQTMLRDLLARVGKTVLLVTHDLDEALYLAQRVIFLEAGEVVADLSANQVLQSQSPHVRAYVRAVHRTAEAAG